ncbi:MAG: hypothetical protein JXB03_03035 [Spirochaetales bacterium]|nr:hypothetical protein [Spirochaetales bacterium]
MKKIVLIALVAAVLLPLSAEDKPTTIYGKFRLDYDLAQADAEASPATLGNFNIDRARFGVTWSMKENLDAKIEVDAHKYVLDVNAAEEEAYNDSLRIAEVMWSLSETAVFGIGRMYEVFAPNSDWHASRFDGIGLTYSAGMAKLALQAGNGRDADPTALAFMPSVIVKPEVAALKLEAGVNAKILTPYTDDTDAEVDAAASANVYLKAKPGSLSTLLNFDANNISDADITTMDLIGDLNYTLGSATPGVTVYVRDLAGNKEDALGEKMDMTASMCVYASYVLTDGLTSKLSLSLKDINEANDSKMNYEVTLRFEFNPKYSF